MYELDDEILAEFLSETSEIFASLDSELVLLETDPTPDLIAGIFRSMHTIKGTAGFLELKNVSAVSHAAEDLLSRLREGTLSMSPDVVTVLLEAVDALRTMTALVPTTRTDGEETYRDLLRRIAGLALGVQIPDRPARASAGPSGPTAGTTPAASSATPTGGLPGENWDAPSRPPLTPDPVADGARPAVVERETIRVDVAVLDELMNVVGELVLTRNQLRAAVPSTEALAQAPLQRLSALTSELQSSVMKTRLQPISNLFGKFPRIVRDLSASLGKSIRLEIDGADTELDRALIEAIKDPFTHLVRNSIDHGIETPGERDAAGKPVEGVVRLSARHESGQVRIEISDDGRGLNLERIREIAVQRSLISPTAALSDAETANLVFIPGFSTAEHVTSVSGRGVGMDVVRTSIEKVGGSVSLAPRPGGGTLVTATIPLTLAIMPTVIVSSGGWRYAIPQTAVEELVRMPEGGFASVAGVPVLRLREHLLPLVSLQVVLGGVDHDPRSIVVVRDGPLRFGLLVDSVPGTEEVVVKPIDPLLSAIPVYAGATIMGDGAVSLILDVAGIAQHSGVHPVETAAPASDDAGAEHVPVVFFRDGNRTVAVALRQVDRLEEFERSDVQLAGGRMTVRYRNGLLPLVEIVPGALDASELVQVVVVRSDTSEIGLVGMVVDSVVDIANAPVIAGGNGGTVSAEVLFGDRVADLIDAEAVTRGVR